LPSILGVEGARIGLERLGNQLVSDQGHNIASGTAKVGLLESTQYLRNQLLRDSDWASMAHSLELRTPLVDATLLHEMARYTPQFVGGAGKKMLANSPIKPLLKSIIHKPKTGFSVPIKSWIAAGIFGAKAPGVNAFNLERGAWARGWALKLGAEVFR